MDNTKGLEFFDTVQFVESFVQQTITSISYTRHSFKTRRGAWHKNWHRESRKIKKQMCMFQPRHPTRKVRNISWGRASPSPAPSITSCLVIGFFYNIEAILLLHIPLPLLFPLKWFIKQRQTSFATSRVCNTRGWDGYIASPTQWTWVWANSGTVKDKETWYAAVYGVAKCQTQLSNWTTTESVTTCYIIFSTSFIYFVYSINI